MSRSDQSAPPYLSRFEVLPVEQSGVQAAQVRTPVKLSVACSPRLGPDRSLEVARRLRHFGHPVAVHLPARMIRDRAHLNGLLAAMAEAGVDDVLLVGGDATPPQGPYRSAAELLPIVAEHPRRPASIGIAGYPEGHPLIDAKTLAGVLQEKSARATYVVTQLCFDPAALLAWLAQTSESGVALPVHVGLPGVVDRRRLLKISMRIGVGPSLAFIRRQRGVRSLVGRSRVTPDRVYDALLPELQQRPELNVAGFHYYTFNQLVDTWKWTRAKRGSAGLEEAASR